MKALLDTHVFLWWIGDDRRLSATARKLIADGGNELFFSAASGWEIAIKASLGRITLPDKPEKFIAEQLSENAIQSLPVSMEHALYVVTLPYHHRDPFDRLLVAQSKLENLPIVTTDRHIAKYGIRVLW